MPSTLDVALLRTFLAVAERSSMTAAANALHLTQGAVSQQVKRLEGLFGAPLFTRDRRGLRLTAPGERLLGKARRLLGLHDELWAEMVAGPVGGTVRLGAPPDLVAACLAPVLRRYAEACPRVELSLSAASSPDLLGMLGHGELDLAVVEEQLGAAAGGTRGGECLGVEQLVWVGARAGSAHLRPQLPVSLVTETCAFRPAVLAALRDGGRAWRTVFENGSVDATAATVRADLAVGAFLRFTVPPGLEVLGADAGLPDLPRFALILHGPRRGAGPAAAELARHLRDGLVRDRLAA